MRCWKLKTLLAVLKSKMNRLKGQHLGGINGRNRTQVKRKNVFSGVFFCCRSHHLHLSFSSRPQMSSESLMEFCDALSPNVRLFFSPTLVFTKLNYAAFWWLAHYISANLITVYLISLKFNDGIGKKFCCQNRTNDQTEPNKVLHFIC